MQENMLDKSFLIRSKNDGELLNILLEIHGYTKLDFAEMFDLSLDTVKSWVRDGKNVPVYALKYLLDTLELELRLMGYMLKIRKSDFVLFEIMEVQSTITDMRTEVDDLPQSPLDLQLGNLITEQKPIKTAIISRIATLQKDFILKHTPQPQQ